MTVELDRLDLDRFVFQPNINVGTERNTLACILKSEEAWLKLPSGFGVEEFTVPLNQALFITIDGLYGKGSAVDVVSVYDGLPKPYQSELESLGGWDYIKALQDLPINPKNIENEAKALLELSTGRRMYAAGQKIKDIALEVVPMEKKKEAIEVAVSEIERNTGSDVVNIAMNGFQFLEKRMSSPKEVPGISSGFSELDKVIQGFQASRLYVVGARKKTGKSMLLLNWAKHMAIDLKIPILWISTEHSIDDEFSRLLSLVSQVPEMAINNGTFQEVEVYLDRVWSAMDAIPGSPFHFVSMPFFTLQKVRQLARKMARIHGIKALFFDFIKTPESEANNKEWQELGAFTYGLKSLAASERIPVISACQVNREGANSFKLDGDIDSDHFAGSDRIAQALSVAFVLRSPNKDEGSVDGFRVLKISDNRHGPDNVKFLLDFEGATSTLVENKRL